MYQELTDILNDSSKNEKVQMLVLTGSGDFYCSGNDFISFFAENNNDKSFDMETENYKVKYDLCRYLINS